MIASPADLTYFVEIARNLNISRAAERLGISQPSLSQAVQRLEASVGTELLIRSKRGVYLTQAGKQLFVHAASLLQSWEDIQAETLASVEKVQGTYSIGCHTSIALNVLSGVLPKMMQEYPKLNISLEHDVSRNITEDVISLKTDMGIVVNPVAHPDLIIHRLYQGEVTLWMCQNKTYATQDILTGKAVLVCDPSLMRTQSLIRQCEEQNIRFSRIVSSNSVEVIADLTANGCGIGILPANAALRARQKLMRVDNAPAFYDDHCLLYRVENKPVQTIQVLSAKIREYANKLDKA